MQCQNWTRSRNTRTAAQPGGPQPGILHCAYLVIRKTIKAATQSPACVWTRAKPSRSYCGHTRGRSKRRALEGEISKVIQSVSSDEMRKQVLKGMRAKTEPGGVILVQRAYTERDTGIV